MSIYKKWSPVMDYVFPNKSDNIKRIMSEYAEHHSKIICNDNMVDENLLPVSLKVLSQIDCFDSIIEKNNFIISNEPLETFTFKVNISYDEYGVDYIEQCESLLREELVNILNKRLKGATAIKVYKIVDTITIDKEDRKMVLTSNFKICGSREEKLKRIL